MPHQLLQQTDEPLGGQPTRVGAVPELAPGVHRRCRTDRLPLSWTRHHRSLSLDAPGPAMHGIGTETRLVPEEHLATFRHGASGNGRIAHALPALDRPPIVTPCREICRRTAPRLHGDQGVTRVALDHKYRSGLISRLKMLKRSMAACMVVLASSFFHAA